MTLRIEGMDDLLANLKRMGDLGERHGARAVRATAEKVRTDAVQAVQKGPATGRVYERGSGQNLSATHQASAPGEAPNTDTGNLAGSSRVSHDGLAADVVFQAPYAEALEFGTFRMEPRPFLNPALMKNADYFKKQLEEALDRAANEVSK